MIAALSIFSGATGAASLFGGGSPFLGSAVELTTTQLGIFTAIICAILVPAAVGVKTLFWPQKHEITNHPLGVEIKKGQEFVPDGELKVWKEAIEERIEKIEERQKEFDAQLGQEVRAIRTDIGGIHDRITNGMSALNDKIAAMPKQIIELLTATRELTK